MKISLIFWIYLEQRRPENAPQAVTLNLPQWMLDAIDQQAQRLGVTRESIIKAWLAQRLEANKNA